MKITELVINGIGGVKFLQVSFHPNMNIICGPNGIGKSTILHAISLPFFTGQSTKIKRNIESEIGRVSLTIQEREATYNPVINVNEYLPSEYSENYRSYEFDKSKLIKFETMRDFEYIKLEALHSEAELSENQVSQQLNTGVNLYNIKEWFAKRVLFESVKDGYGPNTIKNIHLAIECIPILNSDYVFSRVDPKTYDIFVNTPTGEIWYEYLSSGFKSCMSLLLGIIKEIELRYLHGDLYAKDFDGVILIDEIELHLHPEWQARITEVLTTVFSSAQFIVTTHSPHVVQNARPHQIIALISDKPSEIRLKELPENDFGYSAWTVEEVLLDVMGMESTLSRKLQEALHQFHCFIDSENFVEAEKIYNYLDGALHQNSVLRKSLKISLMSIREREE